VSGGRAGWCWKETVPQDRGLVVCSCGSAGTGSCQRSAWGPSRICSAPWVSQCPVMMAGSGEGCGRDGPRGRCGGERGGFARQSWPLTEVREHFGGRPSEPLLRAPSCEPQHLLPIEQQLGPCRGAGSRRGHVRAALPSRVTNVCGCRRAVAATFLLTPSGNGRERWGEDIASMGMFLLLTR